MPPLSSYDQASLQAAVADLGDGGWSRRARTSGWDQKPTYEASWTALAVSQFARAVMAHRRADARAGVEQSEVIGVLITADTEPIQALDQVTPDGGTTVYIVRGSTDEALGDGIKGWELIGTQKQVARGMPQ